MTMRIEIDPDLCEGNALCVKAAPEVFRLGEDSDIVELCTEAPPDELRARVEEAVRRCPRGALSLTQD